VPLTFGVERPSFPSEYEGVTAVAARVDATVPATEKDRPDTMRTNRRARFPRNARLLRHADFERVYKEGRRHFSASLTVFYLARTEMVPGPEGMRARVPAPHGLPALHELRVGFTVGRVLGGAVQRNRMKRRLREAVRLTRPAAALAVDVVINPKRSLLTADFNEVLKEVSRAFEVIKQNLSRKRSGEDGV
jgi:ribonuclease P protein component